MSWLPTDVEVGIYEQLNYTPTTKRPCYRQCDEMTILPKWHNASRQARKCIFSLQNQLRPNCANGLSTIACSNHKQLIRAELGLS